MQVKMDEVGIADIQAWLDDPSTNFGWLVKGSEAVDRTVKRFDSRENETAGNRPVPIVEFSR